MVEERCPNCGTLMFLNKIGDCICPNCGCVGCIVEKDEIRQSEHKDN